MKRFCAGWLVGGLVGAIKCNQPQPLKYLERTLGRFSERIGEQWHWFSPTKKVYILNRVKSKDSSDPDRHISILTFDILLMTYTSQARSHHSNDLRYISPVGNFCNVFVFRVVCSGRTWSDDGGCIGIVYRSSCISVVTRGQCRPLSDRLLLCPGLLTKGDICNS